MNLKCVNRWALTLAAVVALAACGDGDGSDSSSSPTTAIRAGTTTTLAAATQPTQATTPATPATTQATTQATQTTRPESATPAPSTPPSAPSSPVEVAQRFWDATFAGDRDLALRVGVAQVYEQLRSYLSGEESVIDPDTFSFLGCDPEAGGHSCEYRSSEDSIVDQILLSVTDDGRGGYYVGAMRRVCTHDLYGPCP